MSNDNSGSGRGKTNVLRRRILKIFSGGIAGGAIVTSADTASASGIDVDLSGPSTASEGETKSYSADAEVGAPYIDFWARNIDGEDPPTVQQNGSSADVTFNDDGEHVVGAQAVFGNQSGSDTITVNEGNVLDLSGPETSACGESEEYSVTSSFPVSEIDIVAKNDDGEVAPIVEQDGDRATVEFQRGGPHTVRAYVEHDGHVASDSIEVEVERCIEVNIEGPPVAVPGQQAEWGVQVNHFDGYTVSWSVTDGPGGATFGLLSAPGDDGAYGTPTDPGLYTIEVELDQDTDRPVIGDQSRDVLVQYPDRDVPTAIGVEEELELTYTFDLPEEAMGVGADSEPIALSLFDVDDATCDISHRGGPTLQTRELDDNATTEDPVEITMSLSDSSEDISAPEHGLKYVSEFAINFDGYHVMTRAENSPGRPDHPPIETYAFAEVLEVDCIPVEPRDGLYSGEDTGRELFEKFRRQAEAINEFFASGLGTMGAQGANFRFPTRGLDRETTYTEYDIGFREGWLTLPFDATDYADGVADGDLEGMANSHSLSLDTYPDAVDYPWVDTEFPAQHAILGHGISCVYQAEGMDLNTNLNEGRTEIGMVVASEHIDDELDDTDGVSDRPFYSGGRTIDNSSGGESYDSFIFDFADYEAWAHEVGHAFGLPDLYDQGDIFNWGRMAGSSTSTQFTAFCRMLRFNGRPWSQWLDPLPYSFANASESSLEGVSLTFDPPNLSDLEYGDEYEYLHVEYVTGEVGFVIERRSAGISHVPNPLGSWETDHGGVRTGCNNPSDAEDYLVRSPACYDGFAIYTYSQSTSPYRDDLLPRDGGEVDYLYKGDKSDPSLQAANDSVSFDSVWDLNTAIEFMSKSDGTVEVEFRMADEAIAASTSTSTSSGAVSGSSSTTTSDETMVDSTSGDSVHSTIGISVEPGQSWIEEHIGSSGDDPDTNIAAPDLVVELPDGTRVGGDPSTGTLKDDADGVYVGGKGRQQFVVLEPDEGITVRISTDRMQASMEAEDGAATSTEVPIDWKTYVETDPAVVRREDGSVDVEGRVKRESTDSVTIGNEVTEFVDTDATVDVTPSRIPGQSEGKFVTAYVSLGDEHDPSDIELASVTFNELGAVTDPQYGFTPDPPVEQRDGEAVAMIKFWRDEVVELLGNGIHPVSVSGRADGAHFVATTEVEVFDAPDQAGEPGEDPGNSDGNGPSDNPGNGNGPPDDAGNGRGNGPSGNSGNGPPDNPGNGRGNGQSGNSGNGPTDNSGNGRGNGPSGNSGNGSPNNPGNGRGKGRSNNAGNGNGNGPPDNPGNGR